MNLINKGFNELYAILSTFRFISNYHYFKTQLEEKWDIEMDKELNKDVVEMLESPLFYEARHFAHQEIQTQRIFINSSLIVESKDINEYFEKLLGQEEKQLREEIFQLLGLDLTPDFAEDSALQLIFEHIDPLDFPADIKWFLMSLIQNPRLQLLTFKNIIDGYLPLYEKLKEKHLPQYHIFVEWIEGELAKHGVGFLDKYLSFVNVNEYDEIHLNYSLFDLLSSHHQGDGYIHLFVGVLFQKHVQDRNEKKDMDTHLMTLKALADQTRLEILGFLTTNESYGQEIAKKFGITTATVSYHMDYFLGASLIHMKRKGRRLYYSVNKSRIRDCLKFLEDEFKL